MGHLRGKGRRRLSAAAYTVGLHAHAPSAHPAHNTTNHWNRSSPILPLATIGACSSKAFALTTAFICAAKALKYLTSPSFTHLLHNSNALRG
ncbi:hypothetical protein BCR44DRAFT_1267016 [Catenaria anguillulae PL171]|uniref:Uncharacterized protein n=1 Tax=Catenaria anguillulae PL171 TaxID=765915 RepID=A0A1Y2HX13_9FUNG|nr:hypothetical protein BCR44DRAFT_1267016 [Catenaria anguillulae PL171]